MSKRPTSATSDSRLVYSTDVGRRCPNCQRPSADCICKQGTPGKAVAGPVRVARETQGRKGKGVTVITGLGLSQSALETLAKELKKRCGSGGMATAERIEIQGDHRDTIVAELIQRGFNAKRAGG